jgi:hypothetical protein
MVTDTAFVRIPVLQTRVMSKTTEEQAREAANQIFKIRENRLEILFCKIDPLEGTALKLILQSLDNQEAQLLSLFSGAKIENRQTVSYPALPEKPATNAELFYFSEKAGIVNKNTTGAKPVWYEIGNANTTVSLTPVSQAKDIIYYRIPQIVEVSAGVDRNRLAREFVTIYQFGNIVSFPLVPPKR